MAGDLKSVLLGNVLSQRSRDKLALWMEASLTGLERLRAIARDLARSRQDRRKWRAYEQRHRRHLASGQAAHYRCGLYYSVHRP